MGERKPKSYYTLHSLTPQNHLDCVVRCCELRCLIILSFCELIIVVVKLIQRCADRFSEMQEVVPMIAPLTGEYICTFVSVPRSVNGWIVKRRTCFWQKLLPLAGLIK